MEKPKMYRVKSPKDIYLSWVKSLMSDKQLKDWEDYKLHELDGRTPEERDAVLSKPEAIRLRDFCNASGYGVDEMQEMFKKKEIQQLPANYQSELKFKLENGQIINERQMQELKKRYGKRYIEQRLRPGETKPKINEEGFLEFEEITEEEIEELVPQKKKSVIKNKFLEEDGV